MVNIFCCNGPNCDNVVSEWSARCRTRALKNAVMQQQVFHADKALQVLDQEAAPLVVDRDKLKVRVYLECSRSDFLPSGPFY